MSDLKEYVVTAANREILDELCNDIESPGGNLYIPNRSVEVANLRPMSRNTHYYLSEEEAELLKNDPRVISVSLLPKDLKLIIKPSFTETSGEWNKSNSNNPAHKNWGLLRCVEGESISGWGADGTPFTFGTINVGAEGRNVDIIIVDGHINPNHPEYALNSDGTGGSRVVQYNWFQHTSAVTGGTNGTYVYTPLTGSGEADNNHGAHVAGTAAGNTQGWARRANIYNISPYGTNPNFIDGLMLFDYIRAFHNNKPINPATGRKNPTIINNSWGYGYELSQSQIEEITYRGQTYTGPFTQQQLLDYGILAFDNTVFTPSRYLAVDADVEDAILDGIIVVGAASNDFVKIDVEGGIDYDNSFFEGLFTVRYHEGSSPGAAPGAICVGAVSPFVAEPKADFSNCGPRVDIYAPGTNIMSSLNTTDSFGGTSDLRNSNFKLGKLNGTSMASPQVCGVLACVLETYPNMTQAEAMSYIKHYSTSNQLLDTQGEYDDFTSLQGSENRYLRYHKERKDSGNVFPKLNLKPRPSTGAVWPRPRVKRSLK